MTLQSRLFGIYNSEIIQKMADDNTQFFVGESTELEGASLAIKGTAQIDGKFSGKVTVKHLVVGKNGVVTGDIQGETAYIEGQVEESISLTGKMTIASSGKVRGKISYGSIEAHEGAKLVGEISTDWAADTQPTQPTDRLERIAQGLDEKNDGGTPTSSSTRK